MSGSSIYQTFVVPGSVLCPVGVACSYYKHLPRYLRCIFIYLIVAGCINVFAIVLAVYGINNLPLLHVYTFLELVLLLEFYKHIFNLPAVTKIIFFIQCIFPVLCIVNFLFFQSLYTFNTYTRPLSAVIVIAFSIVYLIKLNNREAIIGKHLRGNLISIGLIIYFSSSLIQFAFSNYIVNLYDYDTNMLIWNIHNTLVLIMYILFSIDFYYAKSQ